jgi:hypothetical protein
MEINFKCLCKMLYETCAKNYLELTGDKLNFVGLYTGAYSSIVDGGTMLQAKM